MTGLMPKPGAAFLDPRGHVTQPWRDYLRGLVAAGNVDAALAAMQAEIDAIQQEIANGAFLPNTTQALGDMSITQDGLLQNGLVVFRLVGDEPTLDPLHYYGTDESGVRGFHELPSGGVPYFIPEASTFRVREYLQVLFSMPIDVEGFLDVEGYLVEVD